jgi:hypothetical protein
MCISCPIYAKRVVSKEAAVRIGRGKLVALGTSGENWIPVPTSETPMQGFRPPIVARNS